MSTFPQGGSGNGFVGYPVQYVDPGGNNGNPGTMNAPKKTLSKAYTALASGGEIWGSPLCKWSDGSEGLGLSDGQGIWLNDGNLAIQGFLTQKNLRFKGYGTTTFGPFGTQGARWLLGKADGSTARDNPGVWFVNVSTPITFENVAIIADQTARLGWDYRRNSNGTVKSLTMTSAVRLNGQTTVTVTLPTAPILSMQRNAGRVTVHLVFSEAYYFLQQGSVVRIDSGDLSAHFPNGDYSIESTSNLGGNTYQFTYVEGSGTRAEEFPIGATWASHGVVHADTSRYGVVELHTNTIEFPSTMYLTAAASSDASKFILRDPYGGTHGRQTNPTVSNPGTMNLEIRNLACTFETFLNCPLYAGTAGAEKFGLGPTIDKGEIAGGGEWSWIRGCYLNGSTTGGPLAEQEIARCSNIFNHGVSAAGYGMYQLQMTDGGIYHPVVNGTCYVTADTVLQDTGIGTPIFKTLTLESGNGYVKINNLTSADSDDVQNVPVDLGFVGGAVVADNTPCIGGLGTVFLTPPVIRGGNTTSAGFWAAETKSYDQRLWNGFWAIDGRVAGKRDDIQSAFGVIQHPGFSNLANTDISAWTTSGDVTVTANQSTLGLDNTGKAFKIKCNSGGSGAVYLDVTTPSATANSKVAIGYWIKAATDIVTGQSGLLSDGTYDPGVSNIPLFTQFVPFGNDGAWDWLVDIQPVLSAHAGLTTLRWRILVEQGHDIIVYMPHLLYFSAATYSANESARQLRVFKTLPPYLVSGWAGTMPGIGLVGAKLGVPSSNVSVTSPGTADRLLTVYDDAGNALIKLHGQGP